MIFLYLLDCDIYHVVLMLLSVTDVFIAIDLLCFLLTHTKLLYSIDIVFFGENLPDKFSACLSKVF